MAGGNGGRRSEAHRCPGVRFQAALRALRLASLARTSVHVLSIPPRAWRDAGRGRRDQRVFPGGVPNDTRRQGKLVHRVQAHRGPQSSAGRHIADRGPHQNGPELLAESCRLLSAGRVLACSRRSAAARHFRADGGVFEEISLLARSRGSTRRHSLRERRRALRLFCQRALRDRAPTRSDLDGWP